MKKGMALSLALTSLMLNSCGYNYNEDVVNKYVNCTPYISVEKNEEATYTEITALQYMEKMENKETFICLFHTASCSACKAAKEHYLTPYMEETKNTIYTLDVYDDFNIEYMSQIKTYQPSDSSYIYYNSENQIVVSRPLLQIVDEGSVVAYNMGVSKNLVYMLYGYIL